ncbi:MAG: hypothetical protein J0H74_10065 [Chitinophagaceae bacterium]|nr:hypothetical protein [Chitinophagaceae bacterium]
MKKILFFAAGCYFLLSCNNKPSEPMTTEPKDTATAKTAANPPQSEFADPRYADMGRKGLMQMSSGDIKGWVDAFTDDAIFYWSSGDSLAGKPAISKWWTDRRTNVIDSIRFSKDIWLPLKVNRPQQGPDIPGIWLLGWYMVDVKYKNGKKLSFWVHSDQHFSNNDKIDRYIQYIDRAPIVKAVGK